MCRHIFIYNNIFPFLEHTVQYSSGGTENSSKQMCMTKNGLLHAYKLHDTPFDTLFTLQLQNGNMTQQSAQTKIQLSAQLWLAGFWLLSSALLLLFTSDESGITWYWNYLGNQNIGFSAPKKKNWPKN